MNEITLEESLLRSWSMYKDHIRILTIGTALILGASFFVCVSFYMYQIRGSFTAVALFVLFLVVLVVAQLGFIKILLNITGNKKVTVLLLWENYQYTLQYIVGVLAYLLVTALGLLLFIVPGICWSVRYSMWPLVMVNKGSGIVTSFIESARLTRGSKKNLLFLYISIIGGITVSMLGLFVGLLVAYPVSALTYAQVYRKLQLKRTNETLQQKKEKRK